MMLKTLKVTLPNFKFPKLNFDFKIFLGSLKYSFETFIFISSAKNLASSNIPRYLQLSRSCNNLKTLLFDSSAKTVFKILSFFFPNNANYSISQSVSQSISQSISQSVSQSVSPSVSQSVSQSVSHSFSQLVSRSVRPSVCPSVGPSVSQSVSQSVTLSVGRSISQSVS